MVEIGPLPGPAIGPEFKLLLWVRSEKIPARLVVSWLPLMPYVFFPDELDLDTVGAGGSVIACSRWVGLSVKAQGFVVLEHGAGILGRPVVESLVHGGHI